MVLAGGGGVMVLARGGVHGGGEDNGDFSCSVAWAEEMIFGTVVRSGVCMEGVTQPCREGGGLVHAGGWVMG